MKDSIREYEKSPGQNKGSIDNSFGLRCEKLMKRNIAETFLRIGIIGDVDHRAECCTSHNKSPGIYGM